MKRLYQTEFGGGHLIEDEEACLRRLREEIAGLTEKQRRQPYFDPFVSRFCRMNLSVSREISPEMICRIFIESSKEVPEGAWMRFQEKLRILWVLTRDRPELFPFPTGQLEAYLREYERAGGGPVSHSPAYRRAYQPAYRVVRKEYGEFLTLYRAMEDCLRENGWVSVAIDGYCGSGKTRLAGLLARLFDCNVFHADDFFLPLEKRTPQRMAEIGGNMDRERFREEICLPVQAGRAFTYRPFNCSVMAMGEPVAVAPKAVNIFEGSYTMHPELREFYDFGVFLTVCPATQEARILERNGEILLRRFMDEWIPKENAYFQRMGVRDACRIVY